MARRKYRNGDRLEDQARAVGNNKTALKKRLAAAKSVLKTNYRKMFQPGVFDFSGKRLISDDGKFFLQWSIRERPYQPESYENQQTSRGTVQLYERSNNPRRRNPALRPFAGAKGQIKMPYFDVLGRKFDDLNTAQAFADRKSEDGNEPVDVMSKPDSWTMAYEAYTAYPSSMSSAERKEHHKNRWLNPRRRKHVKRKNSRQKYKRSRR